jgi:hypothetical protein
MEKMKKSAKRMAGKRMVGMICSLVLAVGNFWGEASAQPPENWKEGIAYVVPSSAKITKVSLYMGKTEAGEMLYYEVGIRNVSEKAMRFKLTIYPLEGDPVSGAYPLVERKGKPLALEPKEEMVLKWPVFAKELPKGFALVVQEKEE